ncbi:MAG: hypothetical protein ACYC8T_21375 [Myxococcaceae bacterium]
MIRFALLLAAIPALAFAGDTRDPFQPPSEVTPPPLTCVRGSCRFKVDELKLVGTARNGNPVAMVVDPSGTGYVLKRGSHVGRERAVVERIGAGEVVVAWTLANGTRAQATLRLAADGTPTPDDLSLPEEAP